MTPWVLQITGSQVQSVNVSRIYADIFVIIPQIVEYNNDLYGIFYLYFIYKLGIMSNLEMI